MGELALMLLAAILLVDFVLGRMASRLQQHANAPAARIEDTGPTPGEWEHFGYDPRMTSVR